ncbi:hypothetical protein EDM00_05690 [Ornithobacterium rhinotracheale]|uniref:hypothetical protein n=1 Tax=Ornithobacterium rhinotracheale TaxID=28251 RepID=UPI00129C7DF7|nr:hypothetical protein [Ornithobacterium rhinotracheale]MRI63481.1 hypothetical protein [Ornithobacterium rhinotracheale]
MFVRNTIAVLAGLCVSVALILVGITMNKAWFEELSFIDLHHKSSVLLYWKSVIYHAPNNFFIALLISYGVASTVGGVVTALLVKTAKQAYAMLIGFILYAVAIIDILFVHGHPAWYNVLIFFVFFPCSWLGGKIVDLIEKK